MKKFVLFLIFVLFSSAATAQVTSFNIDSSKFNRPLMVKLDSLYQQDQVPRYEYLAARRNNEDAKRVDSLMGVMRTKDKENRIIVSGILDTYGWLSPQKVGMNASQMLFLVVQHADLPMQKKYLPMIVKAEKDGEILSSNLALLLDRINMREEKKQQYGSQSFTDKKTGKLLIYPVEDADRLDEYRKSMGLGPMKDYAKLLGLEWDVQEYKKMLPAVEQVIRDNKR